MYYTAKGIFRTAHHAKGYPLDLIPVDMVNFPKKIISLDKLYVFDKKVINMTIAASWKTAIDKESNPNATFPQIYHSTSGSDNPITLRELFITTQNIGRTEPLSEYERLVN